MERLLSSDYRVRVHCSLGDSGHNAAERTNTAIGDAVVEGATLEWDKHKAFENLTEDQIDNLTLQEFEKPQYKVMEKIAWRVD